MQAHPRRSASPEPGTSFRGWSSATPPARRAEDEIRAPDTLVEAALHAIADVGSIPTVSTGVGKAAPLSGFSRSWVAPLIDSQEAPGLRSENARRLRRR